MYIIFIDLENPVTEMIKDTMTEKNEEIETDEHNETITEENKETLSEELNKLRHLFVFHEESGVCLYYHPFTDVKVDPQLIAGFLTAISSFGWQFEDEATKKKVMNNDAAAERQFSELKELVYKEYHFLTEIRGPCKFAMLIAGETSTILKSTISQFIEHFMETYEDALKNWNGNVRIFKDVDKMMRSIFGMTKAQTEGEKTTRINLIIPESLKIEWERFSSDVVHASMSQMIRDAVREYMKKLKNLEPPYDTFPEDQESQVLDKKIERIVAKKLEEMMKK